MSSFSLQFVFYYFEQACNSDDQCCSLTEPSNTKELDVIPFSGDTNLQVYPSHLGPALFGATSFLKYSFHAFLSFSEQNIRKNHVKERVLAPTSAGVAWPLDYNSACD